MSAPAQAAPAASVAPCLSNAATRMLGSGSVPHWRQGADTAPVSQTDLDALPARQTRPRFAKATAAPRVAATVHVPVYVHVIKGRHRGERKGVSGRRIHDLMTILNGGMAGGQSSSSVATRYRFTVVKVDGRRRDGWYHASLNGPRDRKMKRRLHRGDAHSLNLYLTGGPRGDQSLLGWSRFPWEYASAPRLDGVSVTAAALPGGGARGYNLGDTLIHEVGHWMGLLHTFQGACDAPGDHVADTPAEGEPSYYCPSTRDTCDAPGLDPVHNFMDFSFDSCMNMFTAGQGRLMDYAFEKWRS